LEAKWVLFPTSREKSGENPIENLFENR